MAPGHDTPGNGPNPAPRISVLMYHQVGKFAEPKAHRACFCDSDSFRRQMGLLKATGHHVISLSDACQALYGNKVLPGRSVVLSFDDGYRNFHEQAFPVLADYGFPAIVFAVSGLLGQSARWLGDGGAAAALMPASLLRELRASGVEIGSHSVSHPRLSRLADTQARQEIADSKACLEDVLGEAVPYFAYPYGDYNPGIREAVRAAGYQAAVTCSRGAANTAANPYEIPRKAISWGDNLAGVFWKLAFKNRRKDRYA